MIDKIEPAELNAVTLNLYKGEDVYNFIESLGIERKKALKVLDFIKDYAEEEKTLLGIASDAILALKNLME